MPDFELTAEENAVIAFLDRQLIATEQAERIARAQRVYIRSLFEQEVTKAAARLEIDLAAGDVIYDAESRSLSFIPKVAPPDKQADAPVPIGPEANPPVPKPVQVVGPAV